MRNRRRQPVVLTDRGERVVGALYGCAIAIATTILLLGVMGLAGWIEGLN